MRPHKKIVLIQPLEGRAMLAGQLFPGQGPVFPNVSPSSYTSADFNNDQKLDLVASPYSNNGSVFLMLGTGGGSFAAPVNVFTGYYPTSFISADLNRDGKVDLAFANSTFTSNPNVTSSVSVLLGKGDGTFQAALSYSVGGNANVMATGDFNLDGKIDLITNGSPNGQNGSLSTLLGNGDGTFRPATTISLSYRPTDLQVGDMSSDGKPDLFLTGNYSYSGPSGVVTTYYQATMIGNGTGGFAAPVVRSESSVASVVKVIDLNGDTRLDLLSADATSPSLKFSAGLGNATFAAATTIPLSGTPNGFTVSDLNADLKPDVLVGTLGSARKRALLGDGTGGFSSAGSIMTYGTPRVADLNSDGKADVFASGPTDSMMIYLGRGDGTFKEGLTSAVPTSVQASTNADFNGDHVPDIALAHGTTNTVSILLHSGVGFASPVSFPTAQNASSIASGDFDRDGDIDLVVASNTDGRISLLRSTGIGSLASSEQLATGGDVREIKAVDLNGDGSLDLVYSSQSTWEMRCLMGNGNGTFQTPLVFSVSQLSGPFECHDFDSDGIPDLTVASLRYNQSVAFLKGNGDGTFSAPQFLFAPPVPTFMASADLDADGKLDLVYLTQSLNSTLTTMRGRGDGTFENGIATYVFRNPMSLAIADVNGDGKPDVIFGKTQFSAAEGTIGILLGRGDCTFMADSTSVAIFLNPVSVLPADVDRNGTIDLAVIGSTSDGSNPPSALFILPNQLNHGATPVFSNASMDVNSRSVSFTFDTQINVASVATSDLRITLQQSGFTELTAESASLSADLKTVIFKLPISFKDGDYRFHISGGTLTSTQSAALLDDIDVSGSGFYILRGDLNRDRAVNFDDLLILAQNYGQTGRTFSQGNVNYSADGKVDFDDLLLLAQRYGTSLAIAKPVVSVAKRRGASADVLN